MTLRSWGWYKVNAWISTRTSRIYGIQLNRYSHSFLLDLLSKWNISKSKRESASWVWANHPPLITVCYDVTSRQLTWHGDIFDDIQNSFSDVGLSMVMICSLPVTKHLQKYWNSSKVDSLWGTTLCKHDKNKLRWLPRKANSVIQQCHISCVILMVKNVLWCQN